MKDFYIKYKAGFLWLLTLALTLVCAGLIFSFMVNNNNYNFDHISGKINYYLLLFNVPALILNMYNVFGALRAGKGIVLMLLSFPLLVINLLFLWTWFVLA